MIGALASVRSFRVHTAGRTFGGVFACTSAAEYPDLERTRAQFLHPNELALFAALPAARRKTTYLLGRYAVKQALKGLLGDTLVSGIEIAAGAFGQPVIQQPLPQPIQAQRYLAEPLEVSISHTETEACAIAFPSFVPMGVDIERIDERRGDVMRTQLVAGELAEAARAGAAGRVAPVLLWTAKEALSKALRCGMTCPFELLAIDTIRWDGHRATGTFKNFTQYKFEASASGQLVLTCVLPRAAQLAFDPSPLLAGLQSA